MMGELLGLAEKELGRPLARLAAFLTAIGLAALVVSPLAKVVPAALSSLTASWLFFAGLAAGGVALSATTRIVRGRFLETALPLAESPAAFFPAALVLLVVVLAGAPWWMPEGAGHFLLRFAARDLAATVLLFALGRWFLRKSASERWGARIGLAAVLYLLAYPLVLSVWAVDLIMALTDSAPSGIVPVQTFMAAFLAAVAFATLLSCRRFLDPVVRLDLGRLLYGFACFWAYLVWCSFLPVWYANLPEEVGEVLARVEGGWAVLSWGVIAAVFLLPFFVLLSESAKRHRIILGMGATSVLAGLYAERFLLVIRPVLPGGGAVGLVVGVLVAAGVAGAFALIVGARLARAHARAAEDTAAVAA